MSNPTGEALACAPPVWPRLNEVRTIAGITIHVSVDAPEAVLWMTPLQAAKIEDALGVEQAAKCLESQADLYDAYANAPREETNVEAMRRSAVDYREAARIVRSMRNPL